MGGVPKTEVSAATFTFMNTPTAPNTEALKLARASRQAQATDLDKRIAEQMRRFTGNTKTDETLLDELTNLEQRLAATKASITALNNAIDEADEAQRQARYAEQREQGKKALAGLLERVKARREAYGRVEAAGAALVDAVRAFRNEGAALGREASAIAHVLHPDRGEHHEAVIRAASGTSAVTASAISGVIGEVIVAFGATALEQYVVRNGFAPAPASFGVAADRDLAALEARLQ